MMIFLVTLAVFLFLGFVLWVNSQPELEIPSLPDLKEGWTHSDCPDALFRRAVTELLGSRKLEWGIVAFTKDGRIVGYQATKGTRSSTPLLPGPAATAFLAHSNGYSAITIVHNHPNGDPEPSPTDLDTLRRYQKAAPPYMTVRCLVVNGPHCAEVLI